MIEEPLLKRITVNPEILSASERIRIVEDILTRFSQQLKDAAIITVRGDRVRISRFPE